MYSTCDRSKTAQMRKIFSVDGTTKLSNQRFPVRTDGISGLYATVSGQKIPVEYNMNRGRPNTVVVTTSEDQLYVKNLLEGGDPRLYPVSDDRPEPVGLMLPRKPVW